MKERKHCFVTSEVLNCFAQIDQWTLYEQLARTEIELAILAKEVTDAVTHVVAGVLL